MIKKIIIVYLVTSTLLILWLQQIEYDLHSRDLVQQLELSEKVIIFYRDDCSDCQKVYPY